MTEPAVSEPAVTEQAATGTGPSNGTVKAVWTDFGGVLTPSISKTLLDFCASTNVPPEPLVKAMVKVAASYGTDDIMLPIDTPLVTEEEWTRQIREILRVDYQVTMQLTTLADVWFGGRETNEAWADRLRQVRASGVFVGMLSNMVPAWDVHWRRMVDPDELFDDVVLSFEVGCRKPQQEIFALAAARAGVRPEESVFVDDLAKNCAGAAAAGWQTIHFTDTAAAISRLDELLSPVEH